MSSRLAFLVTSPRIAPGVLSWPAWEVLRDSDVLTGSPDHPQLPYLAEVGIEAEVEDQQNIGARAGIVLGRASVDPVVWLADPDGDEEFLAALRDVAGGADEGLPEVEVVQGSYDLPGARLLDLVATMDRLRTGCPWDRQQTHESLSPHLLEEAYEAVEAIETGDLEALREELGDVLLQVVFHARVAEERTGSSRFTVDDVAATIVDKLVRRHPHVFGEVRVSGPDEVKANWDAIKRAERGDGAASVTDGVPLAQPALALAGALQRRAVRAGLPEELVPTLGGDVGTVLFALVAQARRQGEEPEGALRGAARAFRERLTTVEDGVRAEGRELADLTREEWRSRWAAAADADHPAT